MTIAEKLDRALDLLESAADALKGSIDGAHLAAEITRFLNP